MKSCNIFATICVGCHGNVTVPHEDKPRQTSDLLLLYLHTSKKVNKITKMVMKHMRDTTAIAAAWKTRRAKIKRYTVPTRASVYFSQVLHKKVP